MRKFFCFLKLLKHISSFVLFLLLHGPYPAGNILQYYIKVNYILYVSV